MRNVKVILTAFGVCLALAGCLSVATAPRGTWRASVDNGDKPGIGIELIRTTHGIRGFMYILDLNKPHDCDAGSRRRMEIHDATERELRFSVQWLPTQREEMVLRLAAPLTGSPVHAELQSVDGKGSPRVFEFVRMP